jgi:outer membrane protein OmpA-like peptidoglycan-associated protein
MGVVMSLLVTSVSAFAQNSGKAEYPRYSFWSNWSLGTSLDVTWENAQVSNGQWRKSINGGMDLFLQHKQNHAIDTRYRISFPTFFAGMTDDAGYDMSRYITFTANVMWSITNGLRGYDPDRRHSWYLLVGAGMHWNNMFDRDVMANTHYADGKGHVRPVLDAGIGYSYRFTDHSSFFIEGGTQITDVPNVFKQNFFNLEGVNMEARLGYMYCFGVTAADQAIAAQKSMMTQDNFGALNSQVAALEQQVADGKNNEKKLQRRINELEQQLAAAMANQGSKVNTAAADSLQNIINQIKADQLNYYAMPFSVQYDVNEWKVSDEEMDKVNAVARVMKDNSNIKIKVVGFPDYTGSDEYNMKLSERRANEVKRLLKAKGVAEDRIEVDFKGKNAPFGDAQYALNRRVSFYRVIE